MSKIGKDMKVLKLLGSVLTIDLLVTQKIIERALLKTVAIEHRADWWETLVKIMLVTTTAITAERCQDNSLAKILHLVCFIAVRC